MEGKTARFSYSMIGLTGFSYLNLTVGGISAIWQVKLESWNFGNFGPANILFLVSQTRSQVINS